MSLIDPAKMSVVNANRPTALKPRTCSHCGKPIRKGSKYLRLVWRRKGTKNEIHVASFHVACPFSVEIVPEQVKA